MDTSTIKDGMIDLFQECRTLTKKFKKKLYQTQIEDLCSKYNDFFDAVKAAIEESESAMQEICTYLPNHLTDELSNVKMKHQKNVVMVDYNLTMVSYFVPVMCKLKSEKTDEFTQQLVETWNDILPDASIRRATAEEIQGGFKNGLCYITTAVCESRNLPNDCYELTLLRSYRDEYLLTTSHGKTVVQEYYNIAPTIVKRINKEQTPSEIYDGIWDAYLKPCVRLIEEGRREDCQTLYADMVHKLEEKYLYS